MPLISEALIKKYATNGPRYTSYPTAPNWKPIDPQTQRDWYLANRLSQRPVSLYFHVPFCQERCTYCGCNTMLTRSQEKVSAYLAYLLQELDALRGYGLQGRVLRQIHFGGGTPTYLLDEEFTLLINKARELFVFEEDAEIAIEVDPCFTRPGQLEHLASLGFNRMSLGVQDFDPQVQKAVNRVQSIEITQEHLEKARKLGFTGVNFDLIYGLPFQTLQSFTRTLEQVIELRPDRLALYNFAFLPGQLPHQKGMDPATLPDEKAKLDIFFMAMEKFGQAGYRYIGMDHFALETDELSRAQANRSLYRNFMGYSPKSGVDTYGVGITSIGETDSFFVQNEKDLNLYMQKINQGGLAGAKGIFLSLDDKIRKWTILRLICHFYLDYAEFRAAWDCDFTDYFAAELAGLGEEVSDGLLALHPQHLRILDPGKILVRNICMHFDAYLKQPDRPSVQFSKTL